MSRPRRSANGCSSHVKAAGLTQLEAMREVRQHGRPTLSESSLQRWEATGSIRLADAIILARVYGVSMDELVGLA